MKLAHEAFSSSFAKNSYGGQVGNAILFASNICELRRNLPGVRWTVRDQVHITMRFIGDSNDILFTRIKSSLSEIKLPPFGLELTSSGFFPNERRPSVFWLGGGESRGLSDLKEYMDLVLDSCGIPPENRKFHPHITIARINNLLTSILSPPQAAGYYGRTPTSSEPSAPLDGLEILYNERKSKPSQGSGNCPKED